MFGTEYAAYKHILETEDEKANLYNTLNRMDYPHYLFPTKIKTQQIQLNTAYTDDFILISEFSEIEGPKPLFTIPTDGGLGFNKNDYSLHVMCVDFHVQQQSQPQISDTKFSLTKDTSIINYWDTNSGCIASCIHHFTLYDIEARGFVRPFCIAYITYDRLKIQTFYKRLYAEFTKITNLLKQSNLNQFRNDLEERLNNLKYTKLKYDEWREEIFLKYDIEQTPERDSALKTLNFDKRTDLKFIKFHNNQSITNLINEIEAVLNVIENELITKNWILSNNLQNTISSNLIRKNSSVIVYRKRSSQISENLNIHTQTDRSKSIPINNKYELNDNLSNQQDNSLNEFKLILDLNYSNMNNRRNSLNNSKLLKSIHQLAYHTARGAFKKLRQIHKFYSKPIYLLKYKLLEEKFLLLSNNNKNEFWSVTLGNCLTVNLANQIDILNLNEKNLCDIKNKSNKIRLFNINNDSIDVDTDTFDDDDDVYEDTLEIQTDIELNEYEFNDVEIENDETGYDFAHTLISRFKVNTFNYKSIIDRYLYINEFNFECVFRSIFLKEYSTFFPHLLYTILKGRPLICVSRYKKNSSKFELIVNYLAYFIPNLIIKKNQTKPFVIYERKQIKLNDLKYFKIIGLCLDLDADIDIPLNECFLKYIPITIENYVSILDIDKCTFKGPKYTGSYLTNLLNKSKYFTDDTIFYLFLITHLYIYIRLAFLYNYTIDSHQLTDVSRRLSAVSLESSTTTSSTASFTYLLTQFQAQTIEISQQLMKKRSVVKHRSDDEYADVLGFFRSLLKHSCLSSFSQSDLSIVLYIIKSFKLKQLHIYNNESNEQNDDNDSINSNLNDYNVVNDQQFPLLVDYDEILEFTA